GIRDWSVTGVQTCALPISRGAGDRAFAAQGEAGEVHAPGADRQGHLTMERQFTEEIESLKLGEGETFRGEGILAVTKALLQSGEIGRASCRERGRRTVSGG